MKHNPYTVPVRRKGKQLVARTFRIDTAFAKALLWFANRESKKYGLKVAQATILKRAALAAYPELRDKYLQLKEKNITERTHAKEENHNPTRVEQDDARKRQEQAIRDTAAQFDDDRYKKVRRD